jgi:hypothetical protein
VSAIVQLVGRLVADPSICQVSMVNGKEVSSLPLNIGHGRFISRRSLHPAYESDSTTMNRIDG